MKLPNKNLLRGMGPLIISVVMLPISNAQTRAADAAAPIDRHALVSRYNIVFSAPGETVPLGNGNFAFNCDGTGLQTFAGNTLSHWAWHSTPLPAGFSESDIPRTGNPERGRITQGQVVPANLQPLFKWMFQNPHPLNLGRLYLADEFGNPVNKERVSQVKHELDVWSGISASTFIVDGQQVRVETCVHPALDAVAAKISSPLIASGKLQVGLDFPAPDLAQGGAYWGDFSQAKGHETKDLKVDSKRIDLERHVGKATYYASLQIREGTIKEEGLQERLPLKMVEATYGANDTYVDVTEQLSKFVTNDSIEFTWPGGGIFGLSDPVHGIAKRVVVKYQLGDEQKEAIISEGGTLALPADRRHRRLVKGLSKDTLEVVCVYSAKPLQGKIPSFKTVKTQCAAAFKNFWTTGGAIDLSQSKDPRWKELERRIVLSQYQTAVQSAGDYPPAEYGLTTICPWYGHFHMEMVWWHLAHFSLWNRWEKGEKAIGFYRDHIDVARQLASEFGYKGLKWPKMTGPEGRDAGWEGNHILIWKEPHPIFFAELDYRLHPKRETLEKWKDIVFGTADCMADFATKDEQGVYHLEPAMAVCERGITTDPVFELAYWRFGLSKAQEWRERLGMSRNPDWDAVLNNLAPMPVKDGVFLRSPMPEWADTYSKKKAEEHPDVIGVFGMLPPLKGVDATIAASTVRKVFETWDFNRTWGWDFPWVAMAAARTGQPDLAVEALLKKSRHNEYDRRGLCDGGYLPGNGGLLYATAMMAAGWDGAPKRHAPGFPDDGLWVVRWEGLNPAP